MLNKNEYSFVYQHAYLPEHLPEHGEAISGTKSYLLDNYLCYFCKKHLIFIGYPLGIGTGDTSLVFQSACERFNPSTIAIIAPERWHEEKPVDWQPDDYYYKLDLPLEKPDPEASYMIRRARKELQVNEGKFKKEHKKIIKEFIAQHRFSKEQIHVFKKIPRYLKNSLTARIIEAKYGGEIAAFSIVDLGSSDYAFYLFNFRSKAINIPGASDLLFWEMLLLAQSGGKKAVNLGLGINDGIRRFKEKWGGRPFLPYTTDMMNAKPFDLGDLAKKL
ncbi:MAG: hypothetical protein JRG81_14905 [Deltaproteobacteria bacterium]|nr:hypothetical protein [Deltaproteobacteria bacterium]MBW2181633.1 hypothetical protein [Deltaproteobacteria bacterium]